MDLVHFTFLSQPWARVARSDWWLMSKEPGSHVGALQGHGSRVILRERLER